MDATLNLNARAAGRLRRELADRRLSAKDLALGVGVSPSTAWRWTTGEQTLNLDHLERCAVFLGLKPWEFTDPDSNK